MKKLLSVMFAAMFAFGAFTSAVLADDNGHTPKGMEEAVAKKLAGSHYDFKEGSVHLGEVETFKVTRTVEEEVKNEKTGVISTVNTEKEFTYVVAIAEYETVRDNWYITTHKEIVYYDVLAGKTVVKDELEDVTGVKEYQENHKASLGAHMHWDIIFYIHLLVLIIPGAILLVWIKRQYSTTSFQIANNILGQEKSLN